MKGLWMDGLILKSKFHRTHCWVLMIVHFPKPTQLPNMSPDTGYNMERLTGRKWMPFIPTRLLMQPISVKDSFLIITFPSHFSIFLGIVEIVLVLICARYLLLDVLSPSTKRKDLLQQANIDSS